MLLISPFVPRGLLAISQCVRHHILLPVNWARHVGAVACVWDIKVVSLSVDSTVLGITARNILRIERSHPI